MTRLLIAAALAALTTSATAATSPAIWEDQTYEETGKYGKPELVDDALGSWCYARGSRLNTRDTMVFERAQQCRTLEVSWGGVAIARSAAVSPRATAPCSRWDMPSTSRT